MSKKVEYVKLRNYERNIKLPFKIYADFESIVVPENNEKQNPDESYINKYQKNVACSYSYKLICVNDKLSKSFKSYLGEDTVYSFFDNMIKENIVLIL